jgi:hypothetical protein
MKEPNLKLGDFVKPTKCFINKQHREDFLYLVVPSIVIGCLVGVAIFVAILKLFVK